jgi:hypothetical protein
MKNDKGQFGPKTYLTKHARKNNIKIKEVKVDSRYLPDPQHYLKYS